MARFTKGDYVLSGIKSPLMDSDAANKAYVDSMGGNVNFGYMDLFPGVTNLQRYPTTHDTGHNHFASDGNDIRWYGSQETVFDTEIPVGSTVRVTFQPADPFAEDSIGYYSVFNFSINSLDELYTLNLEHIEGPDPLADNDDALDTENSYVLDFSYENRAAGRTFNGNRTGYVPLPGTRSADRFLNAEGDFVQVDGTVDAADFIAGTSNVTIADSDSKVKISVSETHGDQGYVTGEQVGFTFGEPDEDVLGFQNIYDSDEDPNLATFDFAPNASEVNSTPGTVYIYEDDDKVSGGIYVHADNLQHTGFLRPGVFLNVTLLRATGETPDLDSDILSQATLRQTGVSGPIDLLPNAYFIPVSATQAHGDDLIHQIGNDEFSDYVALIEVASTTDRFYAVNGTPQFVDPSIDSSDFIAGKRINISDSDSKVKVEVREPDVFSMHFLDTDLNQFFQTSTSEGALPKHRFRIDPDLGGNNYWELTFGKDGIVRKDFAALTRLTVRSNSAGGQATYNVAHIDSDTGGYILRVGTTPLDSSDDPLHEINERIAGGTDTTDVVFAGWYSSLSKIDSDDFVAGPNVAIGEVDGKVQIVVSPGDGRLLAGNGLSYTSGTFHANSSTDFTLNVDTDLYSAGYGLLLNDSDQFSVNDNIISSHAYVQAQISKATFPSEHDTEFADTTQIFRVGDADEAMHIDQSYDEDGNKAFIADSFGTTILLPFNTRETDILVDNTTPINSSSADSWRSVSYQAFAGPNEPDLNVFTTHVAQYIGHDAAPVGVDTDTIIPVSFYREAKDNGSTFGLTGRVQLVIADSLEEIQDRNNPTLVAQSNEVTLTMQAGSSDNHAAGSFTLPQTADTLHSIKPSQYLIWRWIWHIDHYDPNTVSPYPYVVAAPLNGTANFTGANVNARQRDYSVHIGTDGAVYYNNTAADPNKSREVIDTDGRLNVDASYFTASGNIQITNLSGTPNTVELNVPSAHFSEYLKVNSTGTEASATGTDAIALGEEATATSSQSVAIGQNADAGSTGTVAIGNNANAGGFTSVAIGRDTYSDTHAVAIGREAKANFDHSMALGRGAVTTSTHQVVFGDTEGGPGSVFTDIRVGNSGYAPTHEKSLVTKDYVDNAANVGIEKVHAFDAQGLGDSDAVASGVNAIAYGWSTVAAGDESIAIGFQATADSDDTIAIGYAANAGATRSIAIGGGPTGFRPSALGVSSIAMGSNAVANQSNSIAIGNGATTGTSGSSNNSQVAIGEQADALGYRTIAIGWGSESTGSNSIALGRETTANNQAAVAIGQGSTTTANQQVSFAGGSINNVKIPVATGLTGAGSISEVEDNLSADDVGAVVYFRASSTSNDVRLRVWHGSGWREFAGALVAPQS